jgi:hypothetical protein
MLLGSFFPIGPQEVVSNCPLLFVPYPPCMPNGVQGILNAVTTNFQDCWVKRDDSEVSRQRQPLHRIGSREMKVERYRSDVGNKSELRKRQDPTVPSLT